MSGKKCMFNIYVALINSSISVNVKSNEIIRIFVLIVTTSDIGKNNKNLKTYTEIN